MSVFFTAFSCFQLIFSKCNLLIRGVSRSISKDHESVELSSEVVNKEIIAKIDKSEAMNFKMCHCNYVEIYL